MSSVIDTRTQSSRASLPIDYNKRLMLFSGRANPQLAVDIADKLGVDLGPVDAARPSPTARCTAATRSRFAERTCSSCSPRAATRRPG